MRLELQDNFIKKLNRQIAYIAADKPEAAKKFKRDVLLRIKNIPKSPYSYVR
jgi:plasmid stabilization system protein ParE